MGVRDRIELAFESWGRLVCARRYTVLFLSLFLVAASAFALPEMRVENASQSYLHSDDPASLRYEEFQRQFGQDDHILIAIEPPEIFDLGFLEKLRAFQRELETELPHLLEVTSLVNARQTRGEGDTLVVEDLLEDWPETPEDLEDLRRRVFANPLYLDHLISRNGRLTTVTIKPVTYSGEDGDSREILGGFEDVESRASGEAAAPTLLSEDEKRELVHALRAVTDRYDGPDFRLFTVGGAVIATEITEHMTEDVASYVGVTALAIMAILFFLFRRVSGVVYPMVVVAASLTANLGTMVWLGIPFSLILGMLPIFTMCVGVCNAVHVLVIVYQRLAVGEDREVAIAYAFGHSGLAILMTGLTTAAGMLSFLVAELAPIRHLGIIAPVGVLYAFLFSMTLLPALITIVPLGRPSGAAGPKRASWSERFLVWTGELAVRRSAVVLGAGLLIMAAVGAGLGGVRFAHKPLDWFPEDDPARVAVEVVDRELGGATTAEVVIATHRENGLQEPEVLKRIEAAMRYAEGMRRGEVFVGKATSLVDIVKETHRALNANDGAFYRIPEEPELVAQELLLFENSGSDDLEPLTDSQFSTGRLNFRLPMVDATLYRDFLDEIERALADIFGEGITLTVTGRSALRARTFSALIVSMAKSYVFALLVITPLMMLLVGDIRLGLISMAPNLLPVVFTVGVMGLLGVPLDASNMVIGSLVIGLAVDDTIHFLHCFRRDFRAGGRIREAVRSTMSTTGSALFFTSLVLATGFTVMGLLGTLRNTVLFGFLSALGIGVAFIANALLTPALLSVVLRLRGAGAGVDLGGSRGERLQRGKA